MPLNLIFIQPGNYTIDDNGIPGDNISVIRDGNGVVIFTFGHPADALNFTVSTPGVHITVNFTDSLNAANFSIGSLTDPAQTPDSIVMKAVRTTGTVTLVSNGAITEGGNDAAADIIAGALILSAGTGVGTSINALETRTGLLEAETNTGGINLHNTGAVQIGGLSANVDGLDVATSGHLVFTNIGSIFLGDATGAEIVHGGSASGNVALIATGFESDVIANADNVAITATRGSIAVTAGRDIQFGTVGTDFGNDVISSGSLTLTAGQDILIDGFADILSDQFGQDTGGDMVFNAGRNIGILNAAGSSASVTASGGGGGSAIMTTGAGGTLTVNAPGAFALGSASGDVIVNADRIVIDGASGISAPSGEVFLRPATNGRDMILGSASDAAFAVELSNTELNRIFAPLGLTIGSADTGTIRVIAPIAPLSLSNPANIFIRSGTDIRLESSFTVTDDLSLFAGDHIAQLAASTISAGVAFSALVDQAGDDEGTGGVATFLGSISALSATLSGSVDSDNLLGSSADESLFGFGGHDILDGGGGADAMMGGLGNDIYVVDQAGDTITELAGQGTDTVRSAITFSLVGTELENLTLTGAGAISGTGNAAANILIGNAAANSLTGNGGNDTLDGGLGADAMAGGTENDIYFVDAAGDTVSEGVGAGTDTVNSSISYMLTANVENLTLTGSALVGVGNGLANTIIGNVLANNLDGLGGADSMSGGGGNDTYTVDNIGDVVIEGSGAGTDTVRSSLAAYTLTANVENLTLIGAALDGTGNTLNNLLTGTAAANRLDGGVGADSLTGGNGNDTYVVDNLADAVFESSAAGGTDTVESAVSYTLGANLENLTLTGGALNGIGNALNNAMIGNGNANMLSGKAGLDTLTGGGGADQFRFDTALNAATNVDDILDFSAADDSIFLNRTIFTGIAANGTLAAGAFRAGTAAGDADDRILYDAATGNIFYDSDGTGAAAAILFATVTPGTALTNADFVGYI